MNVASKAGLIDFIRDIPTILWPFRNGSLASITMAGLLMSQIFIKGNLATGLSQKYLSGSLYALILFAAGWLLMPYGLAKIGSTPSYTLYSSAICIVIFMIMYWIVDIRGFSQWAAFLKPAGSNPLLTYILPDIYYAILGLSHGNFFGDEGLTGVLRAIIFSLFILAVSAVMTRFKIRLQL
jgi:predicted acyltransferase